MFHPEKWARVYFDFFWYSSKKKLYIVGASLFNCSRSTKRYVVQIRSLHGW